MREAVALEKEFIRDCLPVNSLGLTLDEFLSYIDYIADRRLWVAGCHRSIPGVANPLPWLAEMMDIKKEQNFFEGKVTDYQKAFPASVRRRRTCKQRHSLTFPFGKSVVISISNL